MAVKRNIWVGLGVILALIGFIVAFVGFGRFANEEPSSSNLYTRKEYAPHFLTGSMCVFNIFLMSYHGARGYKTLGLICCIIALFSIFTAGISVDKDFHTISRGWREPAQPSTYSQPNDLNPFANKGNNIFKCDSDDLFFVDAAGDKHFVDATDACEDIKLSASGNVIYSASAIIALIAIPRRMRSYLPPPRNNLMWAGLAIIIIGWTIFMIGLAYFSHKYDDARSFGNEGSLTYIPEMTLFEREEFASLIIFCALGIVSIATTIVSTFRLSLRSITVTAFFAVVSGYAAGAAFGYTGRIIHAGFRTNEQAWGPPFGAKGPVACDYNNDVKDACEAISVCCGGAAIFLFGVVLNYLACYFALTGDIVFGQLNAQAWFNGQVWLTSYPLDRNNKPLQNVEPKV